MWQWFLSVWKKFFGKKPLPMDAKTYNALRRLQTRHRRMMKSQRSTPWRDRSKE